MIVQYAISRKNSLHKQVIFENDPFIHFIQGSFKLNFVWTLLKCLIGFHISMECKRNFRQLAIQVRWTLVHIATTHTSTSIKCAPLLVHLNVHRLWIVLYSYLLLIQFQNKQDFGGIASLEMTLQCHFNGKLEKFQSYLDKWEREIRNIFAILQCKMFSRKKKKNKVNRL